MRKNSTIGLVAAVLGGNKKHIRNHSNVFRLLENDKQKLQKQRPSHLHEINGKQQHIAYVHNTCNIITANAFQIKHQQQAWGEDMPENAHIQTISFSRTRKLYFKNVGLTGLVGV